MPDPRSRNLERAQAVAELLAVSDDTDKRRGHRLTVAGKPDRHAGAIGFARVYVTQWMLDCDERYGREPGR